MGLWLFSALSLLVIDPAPSAAQAVETETLRTSAHPISRDGKRVGCGINFAALLHDKRNQQKRFVGLSGNMSFFNHDGKGGIALKLITKDTPASGGKLTLAPFDIASASLIGRDGASNRAAYLDRVPSAEPGTAILVFKSDGSEASIMQRIARDDFLAVRFTRQSDGDEIEAGIDLKVEDSERGKVKRSDATVRGFGACTLDLLSR
jgi:hypothetical protein